MSEYSKPCRWYSQGANSPSTITRCTFKFYFQITCLIAAIFMDGFGSTFLGISFPTNIPTLLIILSFTLSLFDNNIYIPNFLLIIYLYIVFQTFIFNYSEITFFRSAMHYEGLIIFSIASFSFVCKYRDHMLEMIYIYYKFCIVISCIGIIQVIVFLVNGESVSLQQVLGGPPVDPMHSEIFSVLPRSTGVASEPATHALMLIPGMYISLLVLLGFSKEIKIRSKLCAVVVLIGIILSFSLVGYVSLVVSVFIIAISRLQGRIFISAFVSMFLVVFIWFIWTIPEAGMIDKLRGLFLMASNPAEFNYQTKDLSGYALVSNILVANEGLLKSYYLGTGLNTHSNTYDEVISSLFVHKDFILELNKNDGGSLFTRVISEFGIPGMLAFAFYLYRYRIKNSKGFSSYRLINEMSLIFLLMYSLRNGQYLSILFWLFVALFFYSYKLEKSIKI